MGGLLVFVALWILLAAFIGAGLAFVILVLLVLGYMLVSPV
jgi:hypothetical protein